ncbi:DUF4956 domain-containing protein [Roseomonas hellenica]|uniref:DUF4956 domain-containing protein n=1 Tax=Plastoroseomonas hellenica TaxID=2687306 RepID=A0ABS5EY27_9PROT|nr:DUF4956 domain-containing protein [Plastoroseomonas hellenica]MBR0665204.1 DUF4956 domain-containing protein [Plastoroseomonas hellenica]
MAWLSTEVGIVEAVGDLALALSLGVAVAITYVRVYRGFYHSKSFVHTCVVTVPLVAIAVRSVIGAAAEASAVAFALVGLLGLIRLRTVVRDTREFTFVFLALVTGAGVGAGAHLLAILGCAILLGVLAMLEALDFGAPRSPAMRVRLSGRADGFATYHDILSLSAKRLEATAVRKSSGDSAEFSFEIVARDGTDLAVVAQRLRAVEGIGEVSVSRLQRGRATGEEDG